jgi:hypothetical protein
MGVFHCDEEIAGLADGDAAHGHRHRWERCSTTLMNNDNT